MPVHGEVHELASSLQEDGVPMLVIQEAPQRGRGRAAAGTRLAVICEQEERMASVPRAACSAVNRIFLKRGQLSLSKVKDDSLSTNPELSWAWDGIPTSPTDPRTKFSIN